MSQAVADHEPVLCERCEQPLDPERVVWLELNARTLEWARAGEADWTDGADSQGCFPFGEACARKVLKNRGQQP